MKYLLALPFLLLTTNAHAEVIRKACGPSDYQRIGNALQRDEIRTGRELKNDVVSMLGEEMGPRCSLVIDLEMGDGIPGNKSTQYELIGGGRGYVITLVSSVEENKRFVVIERAK